MERLHGYQLPLTSFGVDDRPSCDITDATGELVASVEWPAELDISVDQRRDAAEALAALFARAPEMRDALIRAANWFDAIEDSCNQQHSHTGIASHAACESTIIKDLLAKVAARSGQEAGQ